jgi:DNA-binding response OmpR family regulator
MALPKTGEHRFSVEKETRQNSFREGLRMTRVLLIEDDEALARGIVFALENEGWAVNHASTLSKGARLLREHDFELLLLDVMLPDGNGFDLCRRLRSESAIPVIFLTACDEEVNVVQGLDLGGDDYVTKPFRVRELISRIRAVLRRKSAPAGELHLRSGPVVLDLKRKQALKHGEQVPLSPLEFKLLQVLLENPLQVISREQILEKLWDVEGDFVDSNTLSVYIRRLREKIEKIPSDPQLIVTVRGFGYKWNRGRGGDAGTHL